MDKIEVLRDMAFGQRVAEEEGEALATYFVETDHWRRLFADQADVVYGPKGSGKSALYSLLIARTTPSFRLGSQGRSFSESPTPRASVPVSHR